MTARWRGHSHPELYNMIHAGPGAGASDDQTQYWRALTDELTQVDADLNKALGELKATWEGNASQTANEGMTPLQLWAGDAQTGSSVMRISSEDQAEYVSTARAEMPKPVEVTTPEPAAWQVAGATVAGVLGNPGPAAVVALQAFDNERQEAAQSAAAQKAVDTMNTYESSSTWNRNTLGTFVKPPDVVVSTAMPAGFGAVGGVVVGALARNQYNSDTRSIQTTSQASTPGGANGVSSTPTLPNTANAANTSSNLGNQGGQYTPAQIPRNDTGTTPANFTPLPNPSPPSPPLPPPPPPGNPPGLNPVGPSGGLPISSTTQLPGGNNPVPGGAKSGGPAGTTGRPGGMPGVGGGFHGDGSHNQLGRGAVTGMGMPGEAVVGRGAGAGAAGAARGGALGGAPMGGMGAGQGDDDDEHFTPDYLMETADVFGDERLVSPAVIGENPPPDEEK